MSGENGRPAGELRIREAQLVGVSFPERTIDLIVIPYEAEAIVPHPREPRMVTEIVSRGAFDGIERRANRIRVNRDHDLKRTVGRALTFHPSREEGLVATVRIARTDLGDETLALADEDALDASAGFLPIPPDGEVWETRSRCRIRKGWLGHIALTPEPAYEGARVLAVRKAEAGGEQAVTPNLAALEIQRLRAEYARIDAKWLAGGQPTGMQ
jgi:HK97 family phage prohead protease